jgi:endonuclease G
MKITSANERKDRLRQWVDRVEAPSDAPRPDFQGPDLTEALANLQTQEPLSTDQAESLEVIIVSHSRPAVPVRDGSIAFEPPWSHLSEGPTQELLKAACAAVGQVESSAAEVPGYAGTAFLVSPDLVITTRNVAESFATGIGVRDLGLKPGRQCQIDFGNGRDNDASQVYPIAAVTMIHPYLDIAVMRLASPVPIAPLELWAEDPGALEDREIAVIAYPQFDLRYGVELQKSVLAAAPGVKRVMPGKVMQPRLQSTLGRQMLALTHDAITLGGRAGGPVVDLATGRVVGVSFASIYLVANFAVPISELAHDPLVWEAGLNFVGASKPSSSPWQEYWSEADPSEATAAAVEQIATPTSVPWVRSAVELVVKEHFSDASRFRQFLTDNGHHEVARAVPEGADSLELLRALDRRGLLDEAFLGALTAAAPSAPRPAGPAGISPWLPQSMLSRVTWALEPVDAETMEIYTIGSPWRDYLLDADGNPEPASAVVQRLAYDTRPEIHEVLAWLLRRLYESFDTDERERVNALYEAVQHLEGGQKNEAADGQVAAQVWANPPRIQPIAYLEEGLRAARSVAVIRLSEEPGATAYGSTGWLLTPDLVVVAAHLLSTENGPVKDFSIERANERVQTAIVRFDFDAPGQQTTEYRVRDVVLSDPYLDIAVLRLVEPVKDRAPLTVRPDALPTNLTGLAAIHHPHLGPKQISRDGRLLRAQASDVLYLIDTAPGSAGAPIFDDQWRVIAVHRAFSAYRVSPDQPAIRAKLGTSVAALLSRLRDREGYEAVWRKVVAAQPVLKSVNVNTARVTETENLPVVIQLLDTEPFESVPGFHITSQGGDIVTGLCDGSALQALIDHPKVLAIDLSKPAGEMECAVSVPHIGAPVIHGAPYGETGDKALIGVIDSGIDVRHRAFCDEQGKTRIVAFWDQQDARSPAGQTATLAVAESPKGEAWVRQFGLGYGALYVAEDIDGFLNGTPAPATFPASAEMVHGTAVAGVAAGRKTGDTADHFAGGVAPAAKLVVVRYDLQNSSIGYNNGHIDALNFIGHVADAEQLPVVVNISNGMNAGAHDGTSPVERQCNRFTDDGQAPGRIIVKSAGNERKLNHHAMVSVPHRVVKFLRWRSQNWPGRPPSRSTEQIEIWFHHLNRYRFELQPPGGSLSPPIDSEHKELKEYLSNDNQVSAVLAPYRAENGAGFLNIEISKGRRDEVEKGEWRLKITGIQVAEDKPLHAWVELMPDRQLFFLDDAEDKYTITIPGTSDHVISVGAIEVSDYISPYENSSWGPTRNGREKPDLMAPGVEVFGPGVDRGELRALKSESGTSLAAPHVTGAIALALSACVKSGQVPHNSFRIRGALQETARHGTRTWNKETGYGALDAEQFFRSLL